MQDPQTQTLLLTIRQCLIMLTSALEDYMNLAPENRAITTKAERRILASYRQQGKKH